MSGGNGNDSHAEVATATSTSAVQPADKDSDSEGDAAEEILEESPDRRWSKRREQVRQRDVPGIDAAYLAMDNETGNEVVWNEVQFSERKNFRAQEEKINAVFDNLTQLVHTNLVKFHKYWTDAKSEKPRIIFITEYMSSGSMSLFLQRTRKSGSSLSLKAWKKWTTQILSALNYLHSFEPPITHGNLSCHTVFIQQNGLIKIGCVAPEAIHHHVKTVRSDAFRTIHYMAPELEIGGAITPAADIYSFGVVALEIACPSGLAGFAAAQQQPVNGGETAANTTVSITREHIMKAAAAIEDPQQRAFIESCLAVDPTKRPTARQLLFDKILFEVHSLKLLTAHRLVETGIVDGLTENDTRVPDTEKVAAVSKLREMAYCQVPAFQLDLDKFLEDVKNGIYPLTAFGPVVPSRNAALQAASPSAGPSSGTTGGGRNTASSPPLGQPSAGASGTSMSLAPQSTSSAHSTGSAPSQSDSSRRSAEATTKDAGRGDQHDDGPASSRVPSGSHSMNPSTSASASVSHDAINDTRESPLHQAAAPHGESRTILQMKASVEGRSLTLTLQLDDLMNRQLTTDIDEKDTATTLSHDLVSNGFIVESDIARVERILDEVLASRNATGSGTASTTRVY